MGDLILLIAERTVLVVLKIIQMPIVFLLIYIQNLTSPLIIINKIILCKQCGKEINVNTVKTLYIQENLGFNILLLLLPFQIAIINMSII